MRHSPSLRRLLCLCLLALCGVTHGCDFDEPAKKVDLARREHISPPEPKAGITYAYLPQYAHTVSHERHQRLLAYLERKTGLSFRQVYPDTFEQHLDMAARGEIDISFVNPFVYVKMAKNGARAFARIVEPDGDTSFRGQIIVRADNPAIATIEDCRGKRWIAVDQSSAGGFLYPLGLFHRHGLSRSDFAEIAFPPGPGGKQEKVVMAVYAGAYDLGSIREGSLSLMAGRIDTGQIKILAETPDYPGWLYAARRGLDPAVAEAVGKALFELSENVPEQAAILDAAGMRAVVPATDADFNAVRELTAELGLGGDSPSPAK